MTENGPHKLKILQDAKRKCIDKEVENEFQKFVNGNENPSIKTAWMSGYSIGFIHAMKDVKSAAIDMGKSIMNFMSKSSD